MALEGIGGFKALFQSQFSLVLVGSLVKGTLVAVFHGVEVCGSITAGGEVTLGVFFISGWASSHDVDDDDDDDSVAGKDY